MGTPPADRSSGVERGLYRHRWRLGGLSAALFVHRDRAPQVRQRRPGRAAAIRRGTRSVLAATGPWRPSTS